VEEAMTKELVDEVVWLFGVVECEVDCDRPKLERLLEKIELRARLEERQNCIASLKTLAHQEQCRVYCQHHPGADPGFAGKNFTAHEVLGYTSPPSIAFGNGVSVLEIEARELQYRLDAIEKQ
jgi:hypothetical protein